jgi:hypothetical protein
MLKTSGGQGGGATAGSRVAVALSTDGGVTFSKPWLHPELVTPICNSAIINYRDALLFSGPYSESARVNLTVLASDDGGTHWPRRLVLVPGAAGYSSIECGFAPAGGTATDCAALYKASDGVRLVRFRSSDIKSVAVIETPQMKTGDSVRAPAHDFPPSRREDPSVSSG